MRTLLQKLIEESEYTCRSYSGRGMMGTECLGVSTEVSIVHFAGDLMLQLCMWANTSENLSATEEAIGQFRSLKTDSMGRANIFYFPMVQYSEG